MPKVLFYVGTAFSLFLGLCCATLALHQFQGSGMSIVAMHGDHLTAHGRGVWAILVALVATLAVACILLRMAALLAPRDLFGAFVALFAVTASIVTMSALLFMQTRMLMTARMASTSFAGVQSLSDLHFAATMMLGGFVSLSLLALRPYFRVQASRVLSALVFFPLPLFVLIVVQELHLAASHAALPASSPASQVFFALLGTLFFAISVHCIRHRYIFLELTNLRELLDGRVDAAGKSAGRPMRISGGIAFDS